MNTESQAWVSGRHGEGFDPDKLLTDVGGWRVPAVQGGVATPRRAALYCSYCWLAVPEGDAECRSCGRTVAQIKAHEAEKTWTSSDWDPARQDALSGEAAVLARQRRLAAYSAVSTTGGPAAVGLNPALIGGGVLLLVVLGVGAGVMMGGGRTTEPASPPAPAPQPPTPTTASDKASVTWSDPYPELRLELVDEAGKVVATSKHDGEQSTVKPGRYRLRTVPEKGFPFHPVERQLTLDSGRSMKLAASPSAVGDFYALRGIRLLASGRAAEAEQAWKLAVGAQPDRLDVRLSLIDLYARQKRPAEAREHVQKVLELDPTNERALRYQQRL